MTTSRIALCILGVLCISFYVYTSWLLPLTIPSFPTSTVIRDTANNEIGEIVHDKRIRQRNLTYEEIPDLYMRGLVWLEDRSFWENNGISIRGILRSIVHNVQAGKIREGASTLSAQTIRNIFWINDPRDLKHKILESMYAMRLNTLLTKEEIITLYINRIGYGYLNYGLGSASIYYFGKEPKYLTPAEQIALLVIPKNPNSYNPYKHPRAFRDRYEQILLTLEAGNILSHKESGKIRSEILSFREDHKASLPFVVDFMSLDQKIHPGSLTGSLKTTFDRALTTRIDGLAKSVLDTLSWRNVSDYGILIAERAPTGPKLRVMIGGKNYLESEEGQVNTTTSLRQPGSTIKPFTYLLAFSKLGLTPESTITDLPVQYKTAEGYSYEPKNYSQDYAGDVTLREALSQSINIPAIKLLERVGVNNLLALLRNIGIESLKETSDHYGLALTLGDGEVSLFELLQAYTIFAYDGNYCQITYREAPTVPCIKKVDKKYTDFVTSILSDRYVKLPEFPLGSALDFPDRWVALKTGTSRNFRDNWTVGFTKHYMIGVWTGNKNGENMKGVSGATGAGEIFARIVYALEKDVSTPEIMPTKKEVLPYLEITSPLNGSVYAKVSTKSDSLQKIALTYDTNILYDTVQLLIDGNEVKEKFINLIPGTHTFEVILETDGKILKSEKSTFRVKTEE